jgi:hypothetical protein
MASLTNRLAATAAVPTAAALGLLGAVRRKRAFHPSGIAFLGTWTATDDLLPPLAPTQPWPVVVRLSKGVGLPGSVPDVLGLAIRIVDLHGLGRHQDLLLASSGSRGVGRMILRPTTDHGGTWYSSLVPYETPVGDGVLWAHAELAAGAEPPHTLEAAAARVEAGELSYLIGVTTPERDRLLGEVRIDERLDADAAEALRFDPENAGPGLRPTGALQELRERAYHASQRFRPTPGDDDRTTADAVAAEATGSAPPGH